MTQPDEREESKALPPIKFVLGGAELFDDVPIRFKVEIESEVGVFKLEMGQPKPNFWETAAAASQKPPPRKGT